MKFLLVATISCLIFSIPLVAKPKSEMKATEQWVIWARRLSGESEKVQKNSISQLKKIPHLEDKLRQQLQAYDPKSKRIQTEVFLALDVISNIKLQGLFQDLLALFDRDQSGYSVHAINSMISPKNISAVTERYVQRLWSEENSPLIQVAILDVLSRLYQKLDESDLQSLFEDSEPQTQSAVLSYIRSMNLKSRSFDYQALLVKAMASRSVQIKMQTLYLVSELKKLKSFKKDKFVAACEREDFPKARQLCGRLETKSL